MRSRPQDFIRIDLLVDQVDEDDNNQAFTG